MNSSILIGIVGGIAVFNSIFFGVLLLTNHRGLLKNKVLGFLFLSLSVRIGKSLILALYPNLPDSIPAIGLLGMLATGPLLFIYVRQLAVATAEGSRNTYWHFLPLLLAPPLILLNSETVVLWLYVAASLQLAVYVGLAVTSQPRIQDATIKKWAIFLTGSVSVLWAVYSSQIIIETDFAYLIATLLATLILYVLLYFAFRTQQPFLFVRTIRKPESKIEDLASRLRNLMETERIYTEPELSIAKLGQRLNVKPYLISHALNLSLKKSFPEFVNEYRIREAERMLSSGRFHHYTIEAIAFDCGFSTPSAFYVAFKKYMGLTPSEYRNNKSALFQLS